MSQRCSDESSWRIEGMRFAARIAIPLCCVTVMAACGSGRAEPAPPSGGRFAIAGDVTTTAHGNVYVRIVDRAQYDAEGAAGYSQIVPSSAIVDGRAAFTFDAVPAGTYTVDCFQDVNGNGRLDLGARGPLEPSGNFEPASFSLGRPSFDSVSFVHRADRRDAHVALTL